MSCIPTTVATLLFVCEGNVCRSPWAERLVGHVLGPAHSSGIQVQSAGTRALVGEPMDPVMASLLTPLHLIADGYPARQLDVDMLRRASLILTATRAQRSFVAHLHPRAVTRTLSIRQLGRLLTEPDEIPTPVAGSSAADRITSLLQWTTRRRGASIPSAHDDVVDPYRQPISRYALATRQMHPPLHILCLALAGSAVRWPELSDPLPLIRDC